MKQMNKQYPLLLACVSFVVIIIIAQLSAPISYVWWQRTISELAAQDFVNAWIMRTGFVSFGVLLITQVAIALRQRTLDKKTALFILIYAVSMSCTGIWSTTLNGVTVQANLQAAQLHSLFATLAGFGLTIAVVVQLFVTSNLRMKTVHLLFIILITGCSILFGSFPEYQGVSQRLLYLVGLTWLSIFVNR